MIALTVANDMQNFAVDKNDASQLYAVMNQFNLCVLDLMGDSLFSKLCSFSLREREILLRCSQGKSNKMIASLLNISEKTVEYHFASIFKKLQVQNRTAAALQALRLGLLDI